MMVRVITFDLEAEAARRYYAGKPLYSCWLHSLTSALGQNIAHFSAHPANMWDIEWLLQINCDRRTIKIDRDRIFYPGR